MIYYLVIIITVDVMVDGIETDFFGGTGEVLGAGVGVSVSAGTSAGSSGLGSGIGGFLIGLWSIRCIIIGLFESIASFL